ncbi:MAG: glycosyltransferase family 2 protein [Planctomycetaceae bacterium]|nr:glycosyltransferase family 2 protein [Planctomycetaceae bacterium]
MQLSVVIPAHNEKAGLGNLLLEIHDALVGLIEFETILVDDASTDGTFEFLSSLQHQVPELKVVRLETNCGQSMALMAGIDLASGDLVATLDGDGQNDPRDLLKMVTQLLSDPSVGMVIGHRRRRYDSWWRLVSSRIANAVRSRILRDATPDSGCGIKVLRRTTFLRLPRFNHMHRFLPALVRRDGWQVMSMEVHHRRRMHGRSHYGTIGRLMAGLLDLAGVAWLLHRSRLPVIEKVCSGHDDRTGVGKLRVDGPAAVHGPVSDSMVRQ